MKYLIKLFLLGGVLSLTSCGLAKSLLKVPGSLLEAAGRTAGLSVNHEEAAIEREEDSSRFD